MNGGYHILSLKNINIIPSGDSVIVPGIYESLEGNYRKPILLSGIVLSGVERSDRYVEFVMSGTSYLGYIAISDAGNLTITIADDDSVTIANA